MQLSSSDWLQIVLSIAGFLVGALLSWVFYRAQQSTDFNRLRDSVNELSRFVGTLSDAVRLGAESTSKSHLSSEATVARLDTQMESRITKLNANVTRVFEVLGKVKESSDISQKIDSLKEITSLRTTVENLSQVVDKAVDSIVSEVRGQQRVLSQTVQENFQEQSNQALTVISSYLKREIGSVVPSSKERDVLLDKATTIIEQAILKMGEFQRLSIEQQSETVLTNVAQKANQQNKEIQQQVVELEDKVETLRLSLPAPSNDSRSQIGRR